MPYLAHLLLTAGKETGVVALLSLRSSRRSTRRPIDEDAAVLGADGGATDIVLPAEARENLRARLKDLSAARAVAEQTGNDVELAFIETESAEIRREWARSTGRGGKPRTFQDNRGRARQSVSRAIDRARDTILKTHAPLGRHLLAFVKTGWYCSYQPEPPIHWSQ